MKTILLGLMVAGAVLASMVLTYKAQSAEPTGIDLSKLGITGRAALTLNYEKGDNPDANPASVSVYDPEDGSLRATLYPDGTVNVHKGTPEEAARLFYSIVTRRLRTCGKP